MAKDALRKSEFGYNDMKMFYFMWSWKGFWISQRKLHHISIHYSCTGQHGRKHVSDDAQRSYLQVISVGVRASSAMMVGGFRQWRKRWNGRKEKPNINVWKKIKMRLELEKQMKKVARMHFRNIMQHIWNRHDISTLHNSLSRKLIPHWNFKHVSHAFDSR